MRYLLAFAVVAALDAVTLGQSWLVRNNHGQQIYNVLIRPQQNDRLAYREYRINPGSTVRIPIDYDGLYDVQIEPEPGEPIPAESPIDLKKLANQGQVFDVDVSVAQRRLPDGSTEYVAVAGWLQRNGNRISQFRLPDFIRNSLKETSWNTTYTANGNQYRATAEFSGERGSYSGPVEGRFSKVRYTAYSNRFEIRGNWSSGNSRGEFVFRGSQRDPRQFQGEYRFRGQQEWHAWNGSRQ